jgi:DNA-binding CsgD family transcriptional regulator
VDAAASADLCADLAACLEARHALREHYTALRFDVLARVHDALGRLRALPTVAELLPAAAEELALSCGFDRSLVSSVRGSTWRAEAIWLSPHHDPLLARRIEDYLTGRSLPLRSGVLETELIRRRVPVLVTGNDVEAADPDSLMAVAESRAYVAAPVCADRRVVGFVQADCGDRRDLTTLDRDSIASFADGLGLVFERTALLERLRRQRARAHDAFGAAERHLAGLDDSETVLVRGDKKSVAVFRTAAGLRRSDASPVDKLLTAREREVIELMVQGAANRRIADELVVAEETVKSHVRSISRKLRASSRADAVSRYLHLRLREES